MDAFDDKEITKDSLVIIGNGFDLAHGLKTGYSDFREWLLQHDQSGFVQSMERIFYGLYGLEENNLWAEFESALGEIDIDDIHSSYQEDHKGKDIFDDIIEPTVLSIRGNFTTWIKDINTHQVHPKLSLPKNAYYLSFNYTDTLEALYGIPKKRICHIHGSIIDNTQLVYGCQNDPVPLSVLDKEEKDNIQYLVRYKTAELLNSGLKKNTAENIQKNMKFFEGLGNIKKVFVIGHSLAEVDWPYFLEVRRHVPKEVVWQITYHSTMEKIRLRSSLLLSGWQNIQFKRF